MCNIENDSWRFYCLLRRCYFFLFTICTQYRYDMRLGKVTSLWIYCTIAWILETPPTSSFLVNYIFAWLQIKHSYSSIHMHNVFIIPITFFICKNEHTIYEQCLPIYIRVWRFKYGKNSTKMRLDMHTHKTFCNFL